MALCDEGYRCDRCREYVEDIRESELYLRYVLGVVPAEELPREPERHIRCSAEFAQFIVDPAFPPVSCDDPALDKRNLPPDVCAMQERVFTRAWRRLQECFQSAIPMDEYPLRAEDLA